MLFKETKICVLDDSVTNKKGSQFRHFALKLSNIFKVDFVFIILKSGKSNINCICLNFKAELLATCRSASRRDKFCNFKTFLQLYKSDGKSCVIALENNITSF